MCELEADIAKANNGAQGSARQFKEEYIMVVQHNLTAMNSNRMLGLTTASQAKSTEKLSSGYKINRAADDAAGLSISEKMRKQIRGLTQASANAQDGISTVQTAEGALNEVQDMLQRMNELAVKSANGTNSEDDREYIQNEIDQLTTEIDRVSTTTKFNETYLLQGNGRQEAKAKNELAAVQGKKTDGTFADTKIKASIAAGNIYTAGKVNLGKVTAKVTAGTGALDLDSLSGALKTELDKTKDPLTLTHAQGAGGEDTWEVGGTAYTAAQLKEMGLNASGADDIVITKSFEESKNLPTGVSVDSQAAELANIAIGTELNVTLKTDDANGMVVANYDATYAAKELTFDLQVGADSSKDNKISVEIESMSASGLGLLDDTGRLLVNGKDSKNADAAVNTIANAIQKVSTQRSALGAVQNRLEHTINNLDNVVENTTSAESQIRDTDMATEMVKYSNNNILAQAGQAMLAQSNQSNQGVLSLLQ
jgi:flagellin